MAIIVFWLALSAFGFWWFQYRNLATFSDLAVNFDGQQLLDIKLASLEKSALVIHFVDQACPCSRFSIPHIETLMSEFNVNIEHYVWPDLPEHLMRVAESMNVPATPAVAIWAANGELAYFGPYSSGAVCGTGRDFVSTALQKVLKNENPQWINHDVFGCYCTFPATRSL